MRLWQPPCLVETEAEPPALVPCQMGEEERSSYISRSVAGGGRSKKVCRSVSRVFVPSGFLPAARMHLVGLETHTAAGHIAKAAARPAVGFI